MSAKKNETRRHLRFIVALGKDILLRDDFGTKATMSIKYKVGRMAWVKDELRRTS